jgi:type I restriction enzyme S subunit
MVDLTPKHQMLVQDILLKHISDRIVKVFGSRANGKAKTYSDLDIVVMGDSPLSVRTMRQLRDDFDESNLPFQVDVVDWAQADEKFRQIIMLDAVDFSDENLE